MPEDTNSKTEKATPKKLRDARKKGQVAKSKDIVSTMILLLLFTYFMFFWNSIQNNLETLLLFPSQVLLLDFSVAISNFLQVIYQSILINILLPIALISVIGGIMGNIIQFGLVFSWHPVKPSLNKINPVSGFKKIFSLKQLKTTAVSILKILAISIVLYFLLREFITQAVFDLNICSLDCELSVFNYFFTLFIKILLLIIFITTVLDFIIQKAEFQKEQRMTKHEVKREHSNMEGNPEIKAKRKQLFREISADDIIQKIKDSKIIIYGPAITVVLHYEAGKTPLPIIASFGKARMSKVMLDVARSEKVPTHESLELAMALLEKGSIDQYIPEETIEGVALALRDSS